MARASKALSSCGITVEVSGEPPPPGKGCVVVYNETSLADSLAFHATMWAHLDRGSAADVFALVPFGRAAFTKLGIALVPRGNRRAAEPVLAEMVEAARAGERVAWGGEGHFAGRDEVLRFKVGASLIAIRAGVPLIPVAFRGGHQLWPVGSVRAHPGTIRVRFGAPISTAGLGEVDARALTDRARAAVAALFAELGPAVVSPGAGSRPVG